MGMTEQDLIAMRDELIAARADLDTKTQELAAREKAMKEANSSYGAIPNMDGTRALALVGGPVAGAMLGGRYINNPIVGGLAGLAAGIGGNHLINRHLNDKYPNRMELFNQAQGAIDNYEDYRYGDYDLSKEMYDLQKLEALDASRQNPGMWSQVTNGAEGYPKQDMQLALLAAKQQEQAEALRQQQHQEKLQQLELQERQHAVSGAGKQNELTDEEIKKQKLKNEKRESEAKPKE